MGVLQLPAEIASLVVRQAANPTAAAPPLLYGNEVFDITSSFQKFGFAIVLFFPLLAFIACCLRVHGRVSAKQMGLDDVLVCVAMVRLATWSHFKFMDLEQNSGCLLTWS
jgi:hypothetical protein